MRRAVMPFAAKNPSALDERDDGGGLLVAVDLGVGQAAVVVDHRVTELSPDAHALLGAGAIAGAGDLVAGPREAPEAFGVHLQQIARARATRSAGRPRAGRSASATGRGGQAARNGRVPH